MNDARPLSVAYLSGSPRITTRDEAGVSGPRAHILGLIDAIRRQGHTVDQFVLGDRTSARLSADGTSRSATGGWVRQVAVDVVRLGLRGTVARRARAALPGSYDIAYERFALFQELGRRFQASGAVWVVESNAIVSQEARRERNALALQKLACRLEVAAYHRADLVVCVSQPLKDLLVGELDVPADKVLVLPNAVDTVRFRGDGPPAGEVGRDGLVVGFVGFVMQRQGLDELIRAVAALRRREMPVRAVIVGDGPALPELRRLAHREGVEESVTFRGQVPWHEVPAVISGFSVGYSGQRGVGGMPMYHSPLKIYEYLAMARPVIATDHADARAAVVDAGAGWTFPAGDADALRDVLARVLSLSAAELTETGRRARREIEEHHTWDDRGRTLIAELTSRGLL